MGHVLDDRADARSKQGRRQETAGEDKEVGERRAGAANGEK